MDVLLYTFVVMRTFTGDKLLWLDVSLSLGDGQKN